MSWKDSRRADFSSSRGRLQIKGGLLPNNGSIGRIIVYYGKDMPRRVRSVGATEYYETKGNLQVIFTNPGDDKNIEFIGEIEDIHRDY